ncbi:hypothetical protein [Leifsonia sp. Leaf264]|uniref:hypothetical protein n=1 Tax=Leifsonia sp. Leaf264 TaxID=1736314 RepID=UPI0006FA0767|nr:hypothetical protein [Leifsonia sp. Leaf264]KQO98275.1 hypothetical protein ASF30_09455 [Leifsonia sp. Leaf264]
MRAPSTIAAFAAAAAAVAIACSGCVQVQMPDEVKATAVPKGTVLDLTWSGAEKLPETVEPVLENTLEDAGWDLKDERIGERSYKDSNGSCVATIHSGPKPSDVATDGDDKKATDRYLAKLYGAPEATVNQIGKNATYVYGNEKADIRSLQGAADDGAKWVTSARVFSTSGYAFFTDLTCAAGGNFDVAFADLVTHVSVKTD